MTSFIKTNRPFKPNTYAFTYEGLYDMRCVRSLSVLQIADLFGCDPSTISHALKRLNVPGRALKQPKKTYQPQSTQAAPAPLVAPENARVA